jgi:hypothetical protein
MRRTVWIGCLLLLCAIGLVAAAPKEHYLATVLLPDTIRSATSGPTAQLEIGIEEYTPDSIMNDLGAILGDGNNQEALLDKFEKMKRSGWVALPSRTGVDVKVIREKKTANGREITLLSDRPISFWEATNSPVSESYRYGLMKFTVNDKGQGSGKIFPIVQVKSISANDITVKDYGVIPLEVPNVQLVK